LRSDLYKAKTGTLKSEGCGTGPMADRKVKSTGLKTGHYMSIQLYFGLIDATAPDVQIRL
jgi:hypothetical protein